MAGKMKRLPCSAEDELRLKELSNNPLEDARVASRAKILLAFLDGMPVEEIAEQFGVSRSMIFRWRARFEKEGLAGLRDKPRTGKPPKYDEDFEKRVFAMLDQAPPDGMPRWNGAALAQALGASDDAVWRVLRRHGIMLARQRRWHVPAGKLLQQYNPEVEGIYISPPMGIMVLRNGHREAREAHVFTRDKKAGSALMNAQKSGDNMLLCRAIDILSQCKREAGNDIPPQEEVLAFLDDMLLERKAGEKVHVLVLGSAAVLGITGWMAAHADVEISFYSSIIEAAEKVDRVIPLKDESGRYSPLARALIDYPQDAYPFIWKKYREEWA